MLEKHDHREITKNKMQILHINTLQERHQYNTVHPRRDTSTHKFPILYYYTIPQNEGIQPAANLLCTSSPLSHSLSHTITKIVLHCFNTIEILQPTIEIYQK